MKTTTISIKDYKDTNLQEIVNDLFGKPNMTDEDYDVISDKTFAIFEYGEFMSAEIVVDENLNIVGGKIIPFKS